MAGIQKENVLLKDTSVMGNSSDSPQVLTIRNNKEKWREN